jgi:hypothetical protein
VAPFPYVPDVAELGLEELNPCIGRRATSCREWPKVDWWSRSGLAGALRPQWTHMVRLLPKERLARPVNRCFAPWALRSTARDHGGAAANRRGQGRRDPTTGAVRYAAGRRANARSAAPQPDPIHHAPMSPHRRRISRRTARTMSCTRAVARVAGSHEGCRAAILQ